MPEPREFQRDFHRILSLLLYPGWSQDDVDDAQRMSAWVPLRHLTFGEHQGELIKHLFLLLVVRTPVTRQQVKSRVDPFCQLVLPVQSHVSTVQ